MINVAHNILKLKKNRVFCELFDEKNNLVVWEWIVELAHPMWLPGTIHLTCQRERMEQKSSLLKKKIYWKMLSTKLFLLCSDWEEIYFFRKHAIRRLGLIFCYFFNTDIYLGISIFLLHLCPLASRSMNLTKKPCSFMGRLTKFVCMNMLSIGV